MIDNDNFDLILTFASGGYDVIYPLTDSANETRHFASISATINDSPSMKPCAWNDHKSSIVQKQQSLSNHILRDHHVPMLALRLGCCGMPSNAEVATVWRANIQKMLNFINLLSSGIEGQVKGTDGSSIREARISVDSLPFVAVTKNLAHFKLILSPGEHTFVVMAQGYDDYRSSVLVDKDLMRSLGDIVLYAVGNNKKHLSLGNGQTSQVSG